MDTRHFLGQSSLGGPNADPAVYRTGALVRTDQEKKEFEKTISGSGISGTDDLDEVSAPFTQRRRGMNRTERVRQVVDEILWGQPDVMERRAGFIHLYGVSQACALLALVRGLDVELGTIAGMLHDLWTYKTGDPTDHAQPGAELAREVLSQLGCFSEHEIEILCQAVVHHSVKGEVHGAYDELLKDADVLQHYLYNPSLKQQASEEPRIAAVLQELGV